MAIDATGTATSPDSIPTYNTAIDNPSGKGLNNIVAAIQTALSTKAKITTSTLAGGPPGSPADKDIWIATDVDANGTRWKFQYNAGSASAYKWEFVGGSPLASSNVNQDGANFAGAWGDTASVVGVTVARAGDYLCSAAAIAVCGASSADVLQFGIAPGAVTPTWFSSVSLLASGQASLAVVSAPLAAVAASTLIKIRYFGGGQVNNWKARSLSVLPTRIA